MTKEFEMRNSVRKQIDNSRRYVVFPSDLGWIALAGEGTCVTRLSFGHTTSGEAKRALTPWPRSDARDDDWFAELVERLQAFARGDRDDFRDVAIDMRHFTPFQAAVVKECRHIEPGTTLTYGQLARVVGHAGAARAVGNVMRSNRVPLIVPCHRVVGSGGSLHGFSAIGGLKTKRRLLDLEAAAGGDVGRYAVAR